MTSAFLTEASLVPGGTGSAFISEATMTAGAVQSAFISEATMVATATVTLSIEAGPALTTDPFELNTLAASVVGTPDAVNWTLDSATNGARSVLIGSGASVTYDAPPTVNGCVLTWRVTATKFGQPPATDTVVHTILNHAGPWFITGPNYLNGPGRTGVKISALDDLAAATP